MCCDVYILCNMYKLYKHVECDCTESVISLHSHTSFQPLVTNFSHPLFHSNVTADIFSDFAFGKWTPCVEEIAILGTVHVVMIIVCLVRLGLLFSRDYHPFRDKLACTKLFLCVVATLMPVLQLTARAGESTATSGDNVRDYLYGSPNFRPFELVSYILSIVAWSCCTLVVGREYFRGAMRTGTVNTTTS